jgi:hypothetical protein
MNSLSSDFDKVFELIEDGDLTSARAILDSYSEDNQNNPDYWWLRIHSTEDRAAGKEALSRLLVLDENYPGAKELLQGELLNKSTDDKAQTSGFNFMRFLPLLLLLLLACGVILFLVFNANNPSPVTDPTQEIVAQNVTEEVPTIESVDNATPTEESVLIFDATPTMDTLVTEESTATEPVPTQSIEGTATLEEVAPGTTPTEDQSNQIATTESMTEIPTEVIEVTTSEAQTVNTDLSFLQSANLQSFDIENQVLDISICAVVGTEAGAGIRNTIQLLADNMIQVPVDITNIELRVIDCTGTGNEQRAVGIERAVIQSYADGTITFQTLQQSIQPVR